MIKNLIIAVFAIALSLAVYLYVYLGFYKPVEIEIGTRGPLAMLYKDHLGAYHMIGPIITDVETWARENKIECAKTFGEYIDDPAAIDQDRLRSHGGCLIPGPLASPPTAPMKFELRPEKTYVIARFSGSPSIGPFKVYPKAHKFIEEKRLRVSVPVIETYDVRGGNVTTEFLFEIESPKNSY